MPRHYVRGLSHGTYMALHLPIGDHASMRVPYVVASAILAATAMAGCGTGPKESSGPCASFELNATDFRWSPETHGAMFVIPVGRPVPFKLKGNCASDVSVTAQPPATATRSAIEAPRKGTFRIDLQVPGCDLVSPDSQGSCVGGLTVLGTFQVVAR